MILAVCLNSDLRLLEGITVSYITGNGVAKNKFGYSPAAIGENPSSPCIRTLFLILTTSML